MWWEPLSLTRDVQRYRFSASNKRAVWQQSKGCSDSADRSIPALWISKANNDHCGKSAFRLLNMNLHIADKPFLLNILVVEVAHHDYQFWEEEKVISSFNGENSNINQNEMSIIIFMKLSRFIFKFLKQFYNSLSYQLDTKNWRSITPTIPLLHAVKILLVDLLRLVDLVF